MVRVTQSMLNTQMLRNINTNLGRMERYQEQFSTQSRINKPSDDPIGISYSLRYRSEISMNEQYMRNVDDSLSWLEFTDTLLDQAGDVIHRARELTVKGANSPNPQEALESIKNEIEQLHEQMLNIANSKFKGKYVFNGQMTNVEPYSAGAASVAETDTGAIEFEIGEGVKLPINLTGNEVFGAPGQDNIFHVFEEIATRLSNGEQEGVSAMLEKLDERHDVLVGKRAEVGAKQNRVELAESRLEDLELNLKSLLSKNEDADMAEVIMNLKMAENVYQASLSAGARIIRPSLVDFLR